MPSGATFLDSLGSLSSYPDIVQRTQNCGQSDLDLANDCLLDSEPSFELFHRENRDMYSESHRPMFDVEQKATKVKWQAQGRLKLLDQMPMTGTLG